MKILYLDCVNSGISGDMFLASLLELIETPDEVINSLHRLKHYLEGVSQLEIKLEKVERTGIQVNRLRIEIQETRSHRTPKILRSALDKALGKEGYSPPAKTYARDALDSLLKAEALVHGTLVEKIHLHELSSVDTLIDILGVTKALEMIGCFRKDLKIWCSRLPLGAGNITTAHGTLAVPAPATVNILKNTDIIVETGPVEGELVTPTGAALLANLNPISKDYFGGLKLKRVVYSTGQKTFQRFTNILRLYFGEFEKKYIVKDDSAFSKYMEKVLVLETDVDDVSGEIIGNFIRKMEESDALDVQVIPSITKKNRPSHIIKVLCHPKAQDKILQEMFIELGTLGVRISKTKRACIDREIEKIRITVNDEEYTVNYKISYLWKNGKKKIVNIKPEYEDLTRIGLKTGFSVKELTLMTSSEVEKSYRKNSN